MNQLQLPKDVKWVGVNRKDGFPIETSYFKTVFELSVPLEEATLQISANTRYVLYVNGTELIHGPCRGDHWHQFCDKVDIAKYLKQGKNIIAAKVTAFPPFEAANEDYSNFGPFWSMSNSAGPLLIVHGEIGSGINISTGKADWYYLNDSAISWHQQPVAHWMGCTEEVDGAKLPWGWQTNTEIDEGFVPAKVKWGNEVQFGEVNPLFLYDRPIKYLLSKEIKGLSVLKHRESLAFPIDDGEITLPPGTTYEAILAAESITTSFVHFNCKGGAGSKVSLLYSEAFTKFDGQRHYKESRLDTTGELRGVIDIYHPSGKIETYSPSWFRTFRFIKITIETGDSPLTIYPLKLVETRFPLENKVAFSSAMPWAQKIWDISLRTLELCMHESYEDCPFYEQLQYTMDTRLQMLFAYIISNDANMQLKTIHDYHTSILPEGILQSRFPSKYPQVIPVFALHWIFMLKDYHMETGDISLLERYRPTMENVLGWFKRKTGQQGLIENLGYWDFADWTDAWDDTSGVPKASLHGPSTIQNLVYSYALEVCAQIMDVLGHTQLAENYRSEKSGILAKVDALCWAVDNGMYKEGPSFDGEYTQHAQLWAVLSGLAKGERARQIMKHVLTDTTLIPCSFVLQFYLFRALERAGMYEETEKLWDLWKGLIDLDLTTVPEIPGKYTRSECHAWGSLILHELPRKFLGVEPMEPGYKKISIRPIGLYMQEMSGHVPTPYGKVFVKWSANSSSFKIEGETPVSAQITMPDGTVHDASPGKFEYIGVI